MGMDKYCLKFVTIGLVGEHWFPNLRELMKFYNKPRSVLTWFLTESITLIYPSGKERQLWPRKRK